MDLLKSNLKGVIGSSKNGILLNNLENEYKRITNSNLNYRSFDYPDLISFLKSMNDILKLSYYGNTCYVHLITSEDDPQCLKKLCNLIQTTKPAKRSHRKNHNNIPSNIILKANEFDNLKISISNDLCHNEKESNGNSTLTRSNSVVNPTYNQRYNTMGFNGNNSYSSSQTRNNTNHSFNQNDNYRNKTNNAIPPYLIPKKSTSQQISNNNNSVAHSLSTNPTTQTSMMEKSYSNDRESNEHLQTNKSFTNGNQQSEQQQQQSDRLTLNESITKMSSCKLSNVNHVADNKSDLNTSGVRQQNGNSRMFEFSVLDWQVNYPDISIDILHKPVRIYGIQSGHAFVAISDAIRDSYYLHTNSFNCAFPGDVFLWQPPINDPGRPKLSIDITKSVPVIYIERISSDVIKVRVIGLRILLEVQIVDLYELPKNVLDLDILRKEINIRQITFVQLAIVPKFVNIWNIHILSGLYFAPDCLDNDGYLFERCEKRGDFLNIMILIYYFHNRMLQDSRNEQRIFVEQLQCEIHKSLRSLIPEFKNLSQKSINNSPDTSLLLSIDPQKTSLENKILIGCTRFFSCLDSSLTNNRSRMSYDDIVLERIVYNYNKKTFHYFDNDNMMANVTISIPLSGLYMINEDFIVSRLSNVTKVRFQMAILVHLPSCSKLRNVIENYR